LEEMSANMTNAAKLTLPTQLAEELTTGIEELDAQHRYFLDLVKTAECLGKETLLECSKTLLLEVARYAQCHFAYEETMMNVYGYPDKDQHTAQHAAILDGLKNAIISGQINVGQMRLQLLEWLTSHIPLDDKPMADFVKVCRPALAVCGAKCGR
jgi:hemerythrin